MTQAGNSAASGTLWLLWRRFTMRHWLLSPKSSLLLVAILALGVGVFLSIRLANKAAVAGFSMFSETLTGNSDLIITPPAEFLPETLLPEIRRAANPYPVSLFPVVETTALQIGLGCFGQLLLPARRGGHQVLTFLKKSAISLAIRLESVGRSREAPAALSCSSGTTPLPRVRNSPSTKLFSNSGCGCEVQMWSP